MEYRVFVIKFSVDVYAVLCLLCRFTVCDRSVEKSGRSSLIKTALIHSYLQPAETTYLSRMS